MISQWQDILTILVVAGAAWYLARRAWRTLSGSGRSSGCGSCGTCSSHDQAEKPFVPIDQLTVINQEDVRSIRVD
jgi:hypothetical protein